MMRISPSQLLASCDLGEATVIVDSWAEPIDGEPAARLVDVTALGDFFYTHDGGEGIILFESLTNLPQGSSIVADSMSEYTARRNEQEFAHDYLCPQFVAELIEDHGTLPPGHCFSLYRFGADPRDPSAYRPCLVGQHLTLHRIMWEVRNRVPDDEPSDYRTLVNERSRFLEILWEEFPRMIAPKEQVAFRKSSKKDSDF
ncbi:MAG: hypothetical protein P1U89_17955 [Verrucomicrobiales bacterium]|nr:hypothetical protein [Verrucomicrobiales bacterium]